MAPPIPPLAPVTSASSSWRTFTSRTNPLLKAPCARSSLCLRELTLEVLAFSLGRTVSGACRPECLKSTNRQGYSARKAALGMGHGAGDGTFGLTPLRRVHSPRPASVGPSNTHSLGEARHNPEFAPILGQFDLVLPDGMPVVCCVNERNLWPVATSNRA